MPPTISCARIGLERTAEYAAANAGTNTSQISETIATCSAQAAGSNPRRESK